MKAEIRVNENLEWCIPKIIFGVYSRGYQTKILVHIILSLFEGGMDNTTPPPPLLPPAPLSRFLAIALERDFLFNANTQSAVNPFSGKLWSMIFEVVGATSGFEMGVDPNFDFLDTILYLNQSFILILVCKNWSISKF